MAFGLWAKNHIGPDADKGGSGGSALPAITEADIGKALVVDAEPVPIDIIPEQTVAKEDDEGDIVYKPTNTDKSAFTLGAEVTLYWQGKNIGTSTVQYNSDLRFNYAQFETPETDDGLFIKDSGDNLRIIFDPGDGTAPESAVVSLTGTGEKAVWSVDGGVIHISLANGVLTMDRTFAEIRDAVQAAPICALYKNEGHNMVAFVVDVHSMNAGGKVTVVMWTGNSFEQQLFIAESDSDYPTAND